MIGFRGSNAVCEQPRRTPPRPISMTKGYKAKAERPETEWHQRRSKRRDKLIRDLAVAAMRSDRGITSDTAQALANFADEVLGVMDA